MIDDKPTEAEELLRDIEARAKQSSYVSDLGEHVLSAAYLASNHRVGRGIDDRMDHADYAMNNAYAPCDMALLEPGLDVYLPVISHKVKGFRAWLYDILVNSEDRPWTISATPIPDLPSEIEEAVIDAFLEEVRDFGLQEGALTTTLSRFKSIARTHIETLTRDAAARMEMRIADHMAEAGWREEFDHFVSDLGVYPLAVMKGPVVRHKPRIKWGGGSGVKVENKAHLCSYRVSPRNIFPSPDSTTFQNGRFIVEAMEMSDGDLLMTSELPGFDATAVRGMLADHPDGWSWRVSANSRYGAVADDAVGGASGDDSGVMEVHNTGGVYDVLAYYGRIAGKYLTDNGVERLDPQRSYEAEVWVSGGRVLRAQLNPHPTGRRPFAGTSFDKVPGDFWGRSIPDVLRDVQRMANATVRAVIKNMAFSAGPIGEVDVSRLVDPNDAEEIAPYRMLRVQNNPLMPDKSPAVRFQTTPATAPYLMDILKQFTAMADDLSGVPAYVLGTPQVAGAGRTLGGLSLLMGNAAKGVKRTIGHVDKDLLEPLIEDYAYIIALFSEDREILFDTKVLARGASGLMQRELSQSRAVELLQTLAPFVTPDNTGEMIVPVKGLQRVLRDVIASLGYRADDIAPDPNRPGDIAGFVNSSLAGSVQSAQPATQPPPLDGRSIVGL